MAQKYFENIRHDAGKVDEGIVKLEETWRLPHLMFIKGDDPESYGESRKILENIKNEILSIKVCNKTFWKILIFFNFVFLFLGSDG